VIVNQVGQTGLVFPVLLGAGEQLAAPLRVTGFGRPVWILFIDVGTEAHKHFAAFFDSIAACWMHTEQCG
jgi:5-methylcytosine-specific restriction enzyme subunit McrC